MKPKPITRPPDDQPLERAIDSIRQLLYGRTALWHELADFQTPLSRSNRKDGHWKKLCAGLRRQDRRQRSRRRQTIKKWRPKPFIAGVLVHQDRQHSSRLQDTRALCKSVFTLDQFQTGATARPADMRVYKPIRQCPINYRMSARAHQRSAEDEKFPVPNV